MREISPAALTMPLSIYAGDISRRPLNLGCRKVEAAARFFAKNLARLRLATKPPPGIVGFSAEKLG